MNRSFVLAAVVGVLVTVAVVVLQGQNGRGSMAAPRQPASATEIAAVQTSATGLGAAEAESTRGVTGSAGATPTAVVGAGATVSAAAAAAPPGERTALAGSPSATRPAEPSGTAPVSQPPLTVTPGPGLTSAPTAGAPGTSGRARFAVVELTFSYPSGALRDPWTDAAVSALVMSPSGKATQVKGFYYDRDTFKVRFAPDEPGTYTYTVTINGPSPFPPRSGSFTASPAPGEGFVQRLSVNPALLGFADGSLFNALGLNDCWYADPAVPSQLGRLFIGAGQAVDPDTYFATYADAGFNLMRWGIENCNFSIGEAAPFKVDGSKAGDQLLQTATRHGFHVMVTMFHQIPYPDAATHPNEQPVVEQYLDYVMARYGAYTDIWELTNETDASSVPDSWLQFVTSYVRAHDPYHHLITNSNPRDGDWTYLDARSPHWYFQDTSADADGAITFEIRQAQKGGLPVLFGEVGNKGCNWDPTSAERMRIHLWTAFFDQAELVFWNSSTRQTYCPSGAANIYLGPEERAYTRVLQDFTAAVDPRAVPAQLSALNGDVHGFSLRSPTMLVAYLHHATPGGPVTSRMGVDAPVDGTAVWIDPATGKVVGQLAVRAGPQTLASPPFAADLALRIR